MERQTVCHTLAPIYNETSRVLILGSLPSPKSRETGFYYGHPQNRFWRVMAALFHETPPQTNEEKAQLLYRRHIALWDVLARCDICGAADDSIQNPLPNDINRILSAAPIGAVFATGGAAGRYYQKLCYPHTGRDIIVLPSTSAANCRCRFEELCDAYRVILSYL